MHVHLIVLNYNGRQLLPDCLPSIVEAAAASQHHTQVTVIDNRSTDDSLTWLEDNYPEIRVIRCSNRGLCSYNDVLPKLADDGDIAILLNNDIKLHADAVDPLVEPLLTAYRLTRTATRNKCFMTAPRCRRFDDATYEGFRTAVRWRFGLVQATALYPGHEATVGIPGQTASAGAVMAVDCRKFIELGGFDPLYLPGRLEDLDFAFRGYMAGYHSLYVPHSLAWHKGMASFAAAFGCDGCDRLALRNTLLFQWKNLRHPIHIARQIFGGLLRMTADIGRAPFTPRNRRWPFISALLAAFKHRLANDRNDLFRCRSTRFLKAVRHERDYFRRFHPKTINSEAVELTFRPSASQISNPAANRYEDKLTEKSGKESLEVSVWS